MTFQPTGTKTATEIAAIAPPGLLYGPWWCTWPFNCGSTQKYPQIKSW